MHLRTLGGLGLEGSDFRRPKPLLLLTYLAVEGPQDRRHLAELFWQGARDPMSSLRVALARLRKAVPAAIHDDEHRITTELACDAPLLLDRVERGDVGGDAIDYRGSFLDGFYLKDLGSELEEWIYGTREFLAERLRGALLAHAEILADRNDPAEAARTTERALDLEGAGPAEPEQLERAYPILLAGDSPRAPAVARELVDYGIGPPAEAATTEPIGAQRRRETPNNLTLPITSFVGRHAELHEIAGLLATGHERLITLLGTAGVGKTRLSIQAAHRALDDGTHPDGVFWIGLDAITEVEQIGDRIAEAIGLNLQGTEPALTQIARFLATKRVLLILDNYEQLIEGALIPAELTTACPKLTILVTSRERLSVSEERVIPVEGLAYPTEPTVSAEEASAFDAVRLFVLRGQRSDTRFRLDRSTLPGVLHICRLVEGAPLGLELAAAWVRALPVDAIAAELERGLEGLEARSRDVPEKHRSLKAAFERSWQLLSEQERNALKRLSVFRGGFRREAASAVVGATLPLLADLVDKSLLRLAPNGRYDRHPLLYQFALEKLREDPDELHACRSAHGTYFWQLTRTPTDAANGTQGDSPSLFERLEADTSPDVLQQAREELPNLRAAWDHYLDTNDAAKIADVTDFHGNIADVWNRSRDGQVLMERALEALTGNGPTFDLARARLQAALGLVYWRLGHYREGVAIAEGVIEPLVELEPPGQRIGIWWACQAAGLNNFQLGRLDAALDALRMGRDVCDADAETASTAFMRRRFDGLAGLAATVLGMATVVLGELDQARRWATEAYERQYRSTPRFAAYANDPLASLALAEGDYEAAARWAREGIAYAERVGHDVVILGLQKQLAQALFRLERYREGEEVLVRAVERADLSGDRAMGTPARSMMGRTLVRLGRHDEAIPHLLLALEEAHAIGAIPYALDDALLGLAEIAEARHDPLAGRIAHVLAGLDAVQPMAYREAREMLERCPPTAPNETSDLDTFVQEVTSAFR